MQGNMARNLARASRRQYRHLDKNAPQDRVHINRTGENRALALIVLAILLAIAALM